MRKLLNFFIVLLILLFFIYLILPNPPFPPPPSMSLVSNEKADLESSLRRAYYTNLTRREVLEYYQKFFFPSYRLNYPPENAYSLIRDQTRSTFLEEVVHPFRESLFVNGFEPKEPKDEIRVDGILYRQKITVKLVTSRLIVRLLVSMLTLFSLYLVSSQLKKAMYEFKNR